MRCLAAAQHTWLLPPAGVALPDGDVHIWRASLRAAAPRVAALRRILSPDEVERAERFYFRRDREGFVVARGLLREILSLYLPGLKPDRLRFRYDRYGKPALEGENGAGGLHFNLSHSAGVALYAISRGGRVGVDVEEVRDVRDYELIAERHFAPDEISVLRALKHDARRESFFHCWARKEAYVKAVGEGLSLPLDQFAVSLPPEQPERLLHTKYAPAEAGRWSLRGLVPAPGYAGAVVVEGHARRLSCWQWPEYEVTA
jgi:4'-phosphopantetheinyl transferase